MRRLRFAVLLALLIGCGGGSFWVTVEFPTGYQDEATTLEVYAIEPGATANCSALVEGAAFPGDAGYEVEDTIGVSLPVAAGSRALEDIGPGRRLFYALGKDAQNVIIMTGCTEAKAGGSGVQEVLIKLDWTCRETNGGLEACDGVDNDCDGSTDEGDLADLCAAVDNATATACDQGQCNYECDTDWVNTNGDWSDGCECQITRNGEEWCDGLDNDCDGETDPAGCIQCQSEADCEDPGGCLQAVCNAGTCENQPKPDGTGCDDANLCTDPDTCTGGVCGGPSVDCSHLDTDCARGECDPADGNCQAQPINEGGGCDDGLYCNVGETCSSGTCGGGGSRDCSESTDQCNDGICNETDDVCEGQPINEGGDCDDLDACSSQDTCQSGVCTAGPTDLDGDSDSFFDDQCPGGTDCDDGDGDVNPGVMEGPLGDPTCSDGKDNDCDGLSDGHDPACGSETPIYRSVGVTATDLNVSTRTVEIAGDTATFDGPMPGNLGVGDVLAYNSGGDRLAFVHGRSSSTVFSVRDKDGGTPAAAPAGTAVGVYRAYTSLADWESQIENSNIAEPTEDDVNPSTDLTGSATIMMVACYNDGQDATGFTISGWTTGADNYIKIYTPYLASEVGTSQRHNGTAGTGYRISPGSNTIRVQQSHTQIVGLEIHDFGDPGFGTYAIRIDGTYAHSCTIDSCLIHGEVAGNNAGAIYIEDYGDPSENKVFNNIIYDTHYGIRVDIGSADTYVYNNTVVDCSHIGIDSDESVVAKNNIAYNNGDNYSGQFEGTSTGNLSGPTQSDAPGSNSRNAQTVTFVNSSGGDFHLASVDAGAKDYGADLSSDSNLAFSDDIDGQAREPGSWDIGADEY